MSVINKMLQDLDARQGGAAEAAQLYTKPAAFAERGGSAKVIAGLVVAVAVIASGAVAGWRHWHKAEQPAAAQAPAPAKVVVVPQPPKVAPLPATPAPVAEAIEVASVQSPPAPAAAKLQAPKRTKALREEHDARKKHGKRELKAAVAKRKGKAADTVAPEHKARPQKAEAAAVQGKEETSAQKAESAYRRGLVDIQEGYLNDGIGSLEQALQANPRHDAARQTLVRALIDSKRTDEAARLLQDGLALDPRQPSVAMLLARLQIEHGGNGIDTLMRTLPYAGNNGEYHAFLAGALQRQQRHREAAEQYQLALRGSPQNGVWLMGLGISLQAERRDGEALDAFRKAKNSGNLSAELQAFVDGKIQQLAR